MGLAYWGTGGIIVTGDAQKPGGGSWSNYSDARLKKDVKTLTWGLEELRQVHPVTYKYNGLGGTEDNGRVFTGVIAQELEKVLPYMVTSQKKKLHPNDANQTDVKVVDPSAFVYVLINSVKEQQELIERQERRIASLERARNSSLSASLVGSGGAVCFAMSLLPLGFIALRRRNASK